MSKTKKYAFIIGLAGMCTGPCWAANQLINDSETQYESFEQLVSEYNRQTDEESRTLQGKEEEILRKYREGLEEIKTQYLNEGNLDGYMEAKRLMEQYDRRKRIDAGGARQEELVGFVSESYDELAEARAEYQKALLRVRMDFIDKCTLMKRAFTQRGKIEDALSTDRLLEKLNYETQQEQVSVARSELIKLFDNIVSPDSSVLVEVFKRNVRESNLAEMSYKYSVGEFRDDYSRRLVLLEKKYQSDGNIDALLAVNKEQARHNNFGELLEKDIVDSPADLNEIQQKYFNSLSQAAKKMRRDIANADKMLLASLYKTMSTEAYRSDDLFKRSVNLAIEEFQNIKSDNENIDDIEEVNSNTTALNEGLVAYYPLNGSANDNSGNGKDLTIFGAVPGPDRFGDPRGAYYFDGANDYMMRQDTLTSDNPFTWSVWVRKRGNGIIMMQGDTYGSGPHRRQSPYLTFQEDGRVRFFSWKDGYRTGFILDSEPIVENISHPWIHVAVTSDGSGTRKMYINGKVVDTQTNYPLGQVCPFFYIGVNGPQGNNFFSGMIDEIRIYNRALSESEVGQLNSAKEFTYGAGR